MTDSDLADILHSPLDEPEPPVPWWPLLMGMVAGALAVIGGYAIADNGAGADVAAPPLQVEATTTTGPVAGGDPLDVAFPPGYQPLSDLMAAKPLYALDLGDEVAVVVGTAGRRGLEPDEPFGGGRWVLETAAGDAVESTGFVMDAFIGGSFSVVFPLAEPVELASLRLVERWDSYDGSGTLAVDGVSLPGSLDDIAIDLGGGAAVALSDIVVADTGASLSWELEGANMARDVAVFIRTIGEEQDVALFYPRGAFFFPEPAAAPQSAGALTLDRDQGLTGELGDATSLVFEVSVGLIASRSADIGFDVSGLEFADL